jgi:Holliday junction resolvase-like predicted endonuclease
MEVDNRTQKRKIGDIGENIACRFLVKRGFEIVEQNYSKKWGEMDIICRKGQKLHFIEVKSVTRDDVKYVSPETDSYRPEDNLHPWKLKRLSRVIQTYLLGYRGNGGVSYETDWQFDVMTVYLNLKSMEAKVNHMEDIII